MSEYKVVGDICGGARLVARQQVANLVVILRKMQDLSQTTIIRVLNDETQEFITPPSEVEFVKLKMQALKVLGAIYLAAMTLSGTGVLIGDHLTKFSGLCFETQIKDMIDLARMMQEQLV